MPIGLIVNLIILGCPSSVHAIVASRSLVITVSRHSSVRPTVPGTSSMNKLLRGVTSP